MRRGDIAALASAVVIAFGRAAVGAELPGLDGRVHEGVATCRGAPCHGSTTPQKGAVARDEYSIWKTHDPHAKAYAVLSGKTSKRIASSLGLDRPPEASELCLDCHADNVSPKLRGARFNLEDGVGCEACHGGSQGWLKPHDSGRPHAANVADGMYPTDDPVARAELCVSCHYGSSRKFVTHRLMGAGHPRMSFELQVFTNTQPPHFIVDQDYEQRGKWTAEGIQVWAIGQAVAVRRVLDSLLDPKRGRDGIWPEFVLFDCHACHHAMSEGRWRPRPSTGLGPGVARLNDSSFLMLRHALAAVDPAGAVALREELRQLHAATGSSEAATREAAQRLRARADGAIPRFRAWKPDARSIRAVMDSLIQEGIGGEYLDYAAAEQASMAIQALADNLYTKGALNEAQVSALLEETNRLTKALDNPENYDRGFVVASFKKLQTIVNR